MTNDERDKLLLEISVLLGQVVERLDGHLDTHRGIRNAAFSIIGILVAAAGVFAAQGCQG